MASVFRQLTGELSEVDPSTVHCPLCCAAALWRTDQRLHLGSNNSRLLGELFLLLLFLFLFFWLERGLALHQRPG